jgi:hypothetical protein
LFCFVLWQGQEQGQEQEQEQEQEQGQVQGQEHLPGQLKEEAARAGWVGDILELVAKFF